nr:XRE family transcriptional regulator [Ornithinimicrobium sp. HY1745]
MGSRIRAAREHDGISLRDLAARAELSPGFISQLERGITEPSLESLRRIAAALGRPLFELFEGHGVTGPAVVARDRRVTITSPQGGIAYSRLSPGSGRLEVLEGILEPGGRSSPAPWSHPSEECVTVLSGELQVEVAGQQIRLAEGDACTFDSRLPHRYLNEGTDSVRFLLAITPPSY